MVPVPLLLAAVLLWFMRRGGHAPDGVGTARTAPVRLDGGPAAPAGWRGRVLQILTDAGPDTWLSTGRIRAALMADGTALGRQAVSAALADMARSGLIRTRGTGSGTVYSTTDATDATDDARDRRHA